MPVPETLTDGSSLPRKYFTFYDTLYRGCFTKNFSSPRKVRKCSTKKRIGTLSMDPWEKAINSKDTVHFGTRMVEAHALTALEKNSFKWAHDLTSQIE